MKQRPNSERPDLHFHECELCALPHRWHHKKKNCFLTLSAACRHFLISQPPSFCGRTEAQQRTVSGASPNAS